MGASAAHITCQQVFPLPSGDRSSCSTCSSSVAVGQCPRHGRFPAEYIAAESCHTFCHAGDEARSLSIEFPSLEELETEDLDETVICIPRTSCDFHRMGFVPDGWTLTGEVPPDGFFYAGGAATIIEG